MIIITKSLKFGSTHKGTPSAPELSGLTKHDHLKKNHLYTQEQGGKSQKITQGIYHQWLQNPELSLIQLNTSLRTSWFSLHHNRQFMCFTVDYRSPRYSVYTSWIVCILNRQKDIRCHPERDHVSTSDLLLKSSFLRLLGWSTPIHVTWWTTSRSNRSQI